MAASPPPSRPTRTGWHGLDGWPSPMQQLLLLLRRRRPALLLQLLLLRRMAPLRAGWNMAITAMPLLLRWRLAPLRAGWHLVMMCPAMPLLLLRRRCLNPPRPFLSVRP